MASTINASTGPVPGLISTGDNSGVIELQSDGVTKMTVSSTGVSLPALAGPAVIEANSSSAALRVTQTGAGNALVVEDEANPDSSPFVINADGRAISGTTAVLTAAESIIPRIATYNGQFGTFRYLNDASGNILIFNKSRGTGTTQTVVQNADSLGVITFAGSDGTSFIPAARIQSEVDGTPGTNDMPGRLTFSTTADGASSPTERMRIDNAGSVGIGASTSANSKVVVGGTLPTSGTITYGIHQNGTFPQASTGSAASFFSTVTTENAAGTMANIAGYYATQGTISGGLRSTPTNQFGVIVDSTLTGATNNFGVYSNIPSGSGRWNFYAGGTATNYFGGDTIINGKIGIGAAGSPSYGTSGQILTSNGSGAAPSWQSPAGGGSWIYLGAITGSGASTIDAEYPFSSFNATYDVYVLVCNDFYGNWGGGADRLVCRAKVNGSYLTSNYRFDFHNTQQSAQWVQSSGASFIDFGPAFLPRDTDTGNFSNFEMYLWNAGKNQFQCFTSYGTNKSTCTFLGASVEGTQGALQGLRFYGSNSPSIWGTIRLYGIKKS